jgi:hypothetical protein
MLLQFLWQKQLDWYVPLDVEDDNNWKIFRNHLKTLQQINVQCVIPFTHCKAINVNGFCDASNAAYGACVYIHYIDQAAIPEMSLLCSKSHVAPLKTITVTRLELCGALLLAKLVQKVKNSMSIDFTKAFLWSDSKIVLSWSNRQSNKMKTFVSHRIAEIQYSTEIGNWRHIATQDNPADVISRGLPSELEQATRKGPAFIHNSAELWSILCILRNILLYLFGVTQLGHFLYFW